MKKFTWINSQVPLIEQVRNALQREFYPVFVSEGTSEEKVERIRHNDYLCKMYRGFTEIQGDLVVFGHSLDQSDDHIFMDRIGRHGKTSHMYVSLLGSVDKPENRIKARRAFEIASLRNDRRPLEIKFFDAATAHVWSTPV
jgi:hypothetical protein